MLIQSFHQPVDYLLLIQQNIFGSNGEILVWQPNISCTMYSIECEWNFDMYFFCVLKFKCLNRAMFNHKVRKLFGFDMTNTEIRYWTWKVLNDQHFEPFWRTSWNIHWIDANCSFSFVLKFKLVQSKLQEVMTGDYFHIVWLVKSTLVNLSFCMNFLNRINWLLVWIIDWADLSDSDKMKKLYLYFEASKKFSRIESKTNHKTISIIQLWQFWWTKCRFLALYNFVNKPLLNHSKQKFNEI